MHYMASQDPDFQKLGPPDQLAYLAHIRGVGPVQGPQLPQPPQENNPTAGLPGGTTGAPVSASNLALGVAGAGIGAGAATVYGPALARAAWPLLKAGAKAGTAYAGTQAVVEGAKHIPGVGQYIAKIPGIDYLPLAVSMMSGGEKPNVQRGPNGEPLYPGAPLPERPPVFPGARYPENPGTFPGAPEPTMPPAVKQAMPLSKLPPTGALPEAQTGEALGRIPTMRPEGEPNVPVPVPTGKPSAPTGDPYRSGNLPTMEPAQSGMIGKHGYDPASRTAVMEFAATAKRPPIAYKYEGVPQEIWNQYKESPSQGSFFRENIQGRYKTTKLGYVTPPKR